METAYRRVDKGALKLLKEWTDSWVKKCREIVVEGHRVGGRP